MTCPLLQTSFKGHFFRNQEVVSESRFDWIEGPTSTIRFMFTKRQQLFNKCVIRWQFIGQYFRKYSTHSIKMTMTCTTICIDIHFNTSDYSSRVCQVIKL